MIAALRAGFAARAQRLGTGAVADAAAELAARIAVEAPEVSTEIGDGEARLSAPGLRLRVFGSRNRAADLRLSAILGGGR